jgi:hypothetical protein
MKIIILIWSLCSCFILRGQTNIATNYEFAITNYDDSLKQITLNYSKPAYDTEWKMWKDCTNKLGQLDRIMIVNRKEREFLHDNNLDDSARAKQLDIWDRNEADLYCKTYGIKVHIEWMWRLKVFYNITAFTNGNKIVTVQNVDIDAVNKLKSFYNTNRPLTAHP